MNRQLPKMFILWFAFVIDSVATFFIPFDYSKSSVMVISYIGFMVFILVAKDLKEQESLLYAVLLGAYYSVLYTDSVYIYILIYAAVAYLANRLLKFKSTIIECTTFAVASILIKEIVIYLLMIVTSVTSLNVGAFILLRLLPTIGYNAVLFVFVYYIYNKHLKRIILM